MKEHNKNIDKYRRQRLPEPEIPADEAWTQMDGILNSSVAPAKDPGMLANLLKYKWVFVSIGALIVVSAIVLLQTEQLLPKQGLKRRSTDLPNSVIVKNKNDSGPFSPVTKPAQPGRSNEIASDAAGSNPDLKNPNSTRAAAPNKTADQAEKAKLEQPAKSGQSAELAILKKYPEDKKKKQTNRNSSHGLSWSDNKQQINTLNRRILQDDEPLINEKNRKESVIQGSKNKVNDKFPAGPATINSGKNPRVDRTIAVVPFLKKRSKFANAYQTRQARTAIEIPAYEAKTTVRKQVRSLQFGPEWAIISSLTQKDYLFAGKDSTSKPALLLIPGIFVSKKWKQHALSFTFSPHQNYFGNYKMVLHAIDSTLSNDSLTTYNNARLIKASGLNFSMYYHFQATKFLAVGGGMAYSFFRNALVRKEMENYEGRILPGPLASYTQSDELAEIINPHFFTLKAGILFNPGRLQAGLNVIVPVTNISRMQQPVLKPLNGQLFLRINLN